MLDKNGNTATRTRRAAGFTLLELLIAVAIIALLVSVLVAGVSNVRAAARKVMCMNQLHEVSFRFGLFADEAQHPYRGDSEREGPKHFRLEDFQESVYRVSEFWGPGGANRAELSTADSPLICPAGPGRLVRTRGEPCNRAVGPRPNVSIGFNMRLGTISVNTPFGARGRAVRLTSRIKSRPWVPLAFDVDGKTAVLKGVEPYYSAPSAGVSGWYENSRFWFPSNRHGRRCNVAFIGGHVLSSPEPERIGGWQWSYQPPLN